MPETQGNRANGPATAVRVAKHGKARFLTEGTENQSHRGPLSKKFSASREAHNTFSVALSGFHFVGALCEEPCLTTRTSDVGPFTPLPWRETRFWLTEGRNFLPDCAPTKEA